MYNLLTTQSIKSVIKRDGATCRNNKHFERPTFNPKLAKVKVNPHAKNQGQRSNSSGKRAPTDKRTDGRYQAYYLPCFMVNNKNSGNNVYIC